MGKEVNLQKKIQDIYFDIVYGRNTKYNKFFNLYIRNIMPADINNYFNNKNDSNEPKKNGSSLIPPKMYKDFNKKVIPLYVLAFILLSLFFFKALCCNRRGRKRY